MARRADTYLGAAAALVAVGGIAVFGYRTLHDDGDDRGSHRGGGGARDVTAGVIGNEVPRRAQIVDPDYQFQLTAPGPEWEVFDRAESDPVWFGQLATMESERAMIQVSIERTGDISLDAAAARVETWLGMTITHRRPITWLGRDVIELEVEATGGGEARRERVFVRDGLLHDVSLVRGLGLTSWDELDVDPIWASFTLLGGTPHATTPAFPARDPAGVGWRVKDRTWESAVVGITVTPPSGWRLMTGRALPDASLDVELANDACGCYATLTSFVGPASAPPPKARTMSIDTIGGSYQAIAETSGPTDVYQVWDVTIMLDNGIRIAFQAWYPRADATTGILEIRRALAAFTTMTPAAQEALARALDRPRFDPSGVGPTWALRNGVYADYQWGLSWRRPAGFWRISTGARANQLLEGAVLVATEPRLKIVMFVVPDDAVADPAHGPQKWLADKIGSTMTRVPADPAIPLIGDGFEGTWVDEVGAEHLHRVAAMIGTAHSFRVHVSGVTDTMRAHGPEIAAALSGLDVRAIAPVDQSTTFEDRRYGYQMDLPGWKMTERADSGTSVDRNWALGQSELIGVVVEVAQGGPRDRFTQMRARLTASAAVGQGTAPRPHESAALLAGEEAVKLSWREGPTLVTVFLAEHDHLLYTLFTRGTESTVDTARRALKFIPRPD